MLRVIFIVELLLCGWMLLYALGGRSEKVLAAGFISIFTGFAIIFVLMGFMLAGFNNVW